MKLVCFMDICITSSVKIISSCLLNRCVTVATDVELFLIVGACQLQQQADGLGELQKCQKIRDEREVDDT